jgi:G3E family GTPase
VVLANGCLCCNLAGDLDEAVMRIFSRREDGRLPRFRRLIIEPSGLADPAPIAQAILRNPVMSRAMRLEAIVTVVDALFAEEQLRRHPETRKQAMIADHLILTKTDMVPRAAATALEAQLRRLNPLAPVTRAVLGEVDAAEVLPAGFIDPAASSAAARRAPAPMVAEAEHGEATRAIVLQAQAPLSWRRFDDWLRTIRLSHGEALLRVKGLVNVAEAAGPIIVHGVHHVLHPPVERAAWPDADHATRVVMITRGLEAGLIERLWSESLPHMTAPAPAPATA